MRTARGRRRHVRFGGENQYRLVVAPQVVRLHLHVLENRVLDFGARVFEAAARRAACGAADFGAGMIFALACAST